MSHAALVVMWLGDLPRALEPLWQVAHDPAATLLWLNAAGVQAEVRWQVSHWALVWMWLAGLPGAWMLLWQFVQVPGWTAMWLKRAPENVRVLWQTSQVTPSTGMWLRGMTTFEYGLPAWWQDAQRIGVPRNTPRMWQLSQRVVTC